MGVVEGSRWNDASSTLCLDGFLDEKTDKISHLTCFFSPVVWGHIAGEEFLLKTHLSQGLGVYTLTSS